MHYLGSSAHATVNCQRLTVHFVRLSFVSFVRFCGHSSFSGDREILATMSTNDTKVSSLNVVVYIVPDISVTSFPSF
jgi:hypothetical protein